MKDSIDINNFEATVTCDGANSDLHRFSGSLEYNEIKTSLIMENTILRVKKQNIHFRELL
jgi:hypothetical protein